MTTIPLTYPLHLNTPEFHRKFEEWIDFRKARAKITGDKSRFFQNQLERLATLTEREAIKTLELSITQQYVGLFPQREKELKVAHNPRLSSFKPEVVTQAQSDAVSAVKAMERAMGWGV